MGFNIAIDGPAGAGKSTVARLVARELSYIYVDTGALYRALALYFLNKHIDTKDETAVAAACSKVLVSLYYENNEQQVLLNGENVTGLIRSEEVGNIASLTSAYPAVREKLLQLQQKLAVDENVVMDGRDIGTCVLKEAPLKIYLTASVATRGKRRFDELTAKAISCNIEEICKDIEERDERDMHRTLSPLMQAKDAILVDSSDMSVKEVVETIIFYAKERGAVLKREK